MTTLPLDFPPLRAEAARLARERYAVACDVQAALIEIEAHLLADLSRPESRDLWVRWLARRLGLACSTTAPSWRPRTDLSCVLADCPSPDDSDPDGYCYMCEHQRAIVIGWCLGNLAGDRIILWCSTDAGAPPERTIPALAGITDPVEALRTAILSMGVGRG
jgi:hypothetical protein